jgi:uncharacterized protein (DUF488 family)
MVLTVGHSTRPLGEFIDLLRHHGVTLVVDVRTIPRSRHNPQYNIETLPAALAEAGIEYRHLPRLGGLRRTRRDSPNTAWRNASFRGFADYMQTDDFEAGLQELLDLTRRAQVALMCAEAVPWRCHRSLIADALQARGVQVAHVLGSEAPRPHTLSVIARVDGTRVTYPGQGGDHGSLDS